MMESGFGKRFNYMRNNSLSVHEVLQSDGCTWSGWMRRKGKINRALGTVLNIPWRQNFVVLVNGVMHLYVNELARRPRKYLPLIKFNGVTRAYNIEDSPWCFHMIPLSTTDRAQLFRCSTESELKDCMGHIREGILDAHKKPSELKENYNEVEYFVLEKPILDDDYIDIMEQNEYHCHNAESVRPVSTQSTDEEQEDYPVPYTHMPHIMVTEQGTYQNIGGDGHCLSKPWSDTSSSTRKSQTSSEISNQSNTDNAQQIFDRITLHRCSRTSDKSNSSASTANDSMMYEDRLSFSPTEIDDEARHEGHINKCWDSLPPSPTPTRLPTPPRSPIPLRPPTIARSMTISSSLTTSQSQRTSRPLMTSRSSMTPRSSTNLIPDLSTTLVGLEDLEISSHSRTISPHQMSPDFEKQQGVIVGPSEEECYSQVEFASIYHFVDTSDKKETARILSEWSIEGAYLVRNSRKTSGLVLSVYTYGVKEYQLQRMIDSKWFLIKDAVFRSLEELLHFYSDNPLPNRDLKLRPDVGRLS